MMLIVSGVIIIIGLVIWEGTLVRLTYGRDPKTDHHAVAKWMGVRFVVFGVILSLSQIIQAALFQQYHVMIDTVIALLFSVYISFTIPNFRTNTGKSNTGKSTRNKRTYSVVL